MKTQEIHISSSKSSGSLSIFWALLFQNLGKALLIAIPAMGTVSLGTFWLFSRASASDVEKAQAKAEKQIKLVEKKASEEIKALREKLERAVSKTSENVAEIQVRIQGLRIQIRQDIKEIVSDLIAPLAERTSRTERLLEKRTRPR